MGLKANHVRRGTVVRIALACGSAGLALGALLRFTGLGPRGVMAAAAACALVLALACVSARERRLAARRRYEDEQARAVRRDAAVRILWAASGDFLAAGWGRNDLETLRLLSQNLRDGQVLGSRLNERLRCAVSSVLASVLDRLGDVAMTAREIEVEPQAVDRLEAAVRVLGTELDGASCRAGQPLPFRPAAVARAATAAVDACGAIRDALRPWMVSDLPALVSWLVKTRHETRTANGELIAEFDLPVADRRVAVRPLDLAHALDELLERVFGRGCVAGPVRVAVRATDDLVVLSVGWPVDDRFRVDPRALGEPLRVLSSYGAQLGFVDGLDAGTARFDIGLPRAEGPVVFRDDRERNLPAVWTSERRSRGPVG